MKKLITILFLVPLLVSAQDSTEYYVDSTINIRADSAVISKSDFKAFNDWLESVKMGHLEYQEVTTDKVKLLNAFWNWKETILRVKKRKIKK